MRHDLLALTPDDLITLSNRGLVKRAQKELGEVSFTLEESPEGRVDVQWADEIHCTLPAGKTLADSQCSCAAVGLCRHILRSVLAYQQHHNTSTSNPPDLSPSTLPSSSSSTLPTSSSSSPSTLPSSDFQSSKSPTSAHPWDPGAVTDETLASLYNKAALTRARSLYEEGHVIELVRSNKPTARIHTLGLTLRFLVPHDIRYVHCPCDEPAPCRHVPLAVWAFRQLEPKAVAGLISTRRQEWPIPADLLDEIDTTLQDWIHEGCNLSQAMVDRLRRLEQRCRAETLIWPAECLAEFILERERYIAHDARFMPARMVALLGEIKIRLTAIRNNTEAVPQPLIRGLARDAETAVSAARLIGLGCGAEIYRGGLTLSAYLHDIDSGQVLTVQHDFADEEQPFWHLANRSLIQGLGLGQIGARQLLTKGGKRSANNRFTLGRARAAVNPQTFTWESLRAPTLAEDFSEVRAHLLAQPPACLRPRQLTANFYVCPISGVEEAGFDPITQQVQARLRDSNGVTARLIHPYMSRSNEGCEALLTTLTTRPETIRFIAGKARLAGELIFEPTALVVEENGTRTLLQPWIDRWGNTAVLGTGTEETFTRDPLHAYLTQTAELSGELLVTGLQHTTEKTIQRWQAHYEQGKTLGLVKFLEPLDRLVTVLKQKNEVMRWEWHPAAAAFMELALLTRLAVEI